MDSAEAISVQYERGMTAANACEEDLLYEYSL